MVKTIHNSMLSNSNTIFSNCMHVFLIVRWFTKNYQNDTFTKSWQNQLILTTGTCINKSDQLLSVTYHSRFEHRSITRKEYRRRRSTQMAKELTPPDLEVIHDDIAPKIKIEILGEFVDDLRRSGREPNIDKTILDAAIRKLKDNLDDRFGKYWHIVVSCNQQLALFNYCAGHMCHFSLGRFVVLIWKTAQN